MTAPARETPTPPADAPSTSEDRLKRMSRVLLVLSTALAVLAVVLALRERRMLAQAREFVDTLQIDLKEGRVAPGAVAERTREAEAKWARSLNAGRSFCWCLLAAGGTLAAAVAVRVWWWSAARGLPPAPGFWSGVAILGGWVLMDLPYVVRFERDYGLLWR